MIHRGIQINTMAGLKYNLNWVLLALSKFSKGTPTYEYFWERYIDLTRMLGAKNYEESLEGSMKYRVFRKLIINEKCGKN